MQPVAVVIKLLLNYTRVKKIFNDPNIKVGLHQTSRDTSKIKIYNSLTKTATVTNRVTAVMNVPRNDL